MVKKSGRVFMSALGMPPEGDPRWSGIYDAVALADELAAETAELISNAAVRRPDQPKSLDDLADAAWTKFNSPKASAQAQPRHAPPAEQPPQSLDDIAPAAWARFNGAGKETR